MKKPILFIGPRCSGKSTKLINVLKKIEGNYIFPSHFNENVINQIGLLNRYSNIKLEAIAFDEMSIDKFSIVYESIFKMDIRIYAVIQMEKKMLPFWIVDNCEIIECFYGEWKGQSK